MKLYSGSWSVAYRKKGESLYNIVKNPSWGYAADPFLVEENGKVYIFAELFDQREGKASLGYCTINNNKCSKWKVILKENFHMSYPHIFKMDGNWVICPESCEDKTVFLYKCKEFPDKWEKTNPFINDMDCSDTTFLCQDGIFYGVTCLFHENPMKLLLFKYEDGKLTFSEKNPLIKGGELARSGGAYFNDGNKTYRVSQDCSSEYGKSLVFTEFQLNWPSFSEKVVKRIHFDELLFDKKVNGIGIHTYNCSDNYETIDIKTRGINLIPRIWKNIYKFMK
jgi:hypothetical protein